MEQIQKSQKVSREEEETIEEPEIPDQADLTLTDDLLDEIDSVLEQNAEEFVKGYIQKGGQ